MCGVAIEVPDRMENALPVPDAADTVETPGAVTPGRNTLSPMRGPADEKLATRANPEFAIEPALFASALAGAGGFEPAVPPVSATASAARTPKNGIVTGS